MRLFNNSVILAAVAACAITASAADVDWTWRMPVEYYQNLDFEHRAAIDKARDAYIRAEQSTQRNESFPDKQLPLYRAAAAEWEKYRVQFELDNDFNADAVNAYVEFMHAYSLQGARDRNKAIKIYQGLLDMYPDETWITTAAIYMIGANLNANGEAQHAKAKFLEIVEDPQMVKHPLAARAYRRLGDFYWGIKKYSEARDYWRQGFSEQYKPIAKSDYEDLRNILRASAAVLHKWDEVSEAIYTGIDEKNVKERYKVLTAAEDYFHYGWIINWLNEWYYNKEFDGKDKEYKADRTKFWQGLSNWHEGQKALFLENEAEWAFIIRSFDYRRDYSYPEAKKFIPEVTKTLKGSPDESKDTRVKEFAVRLADMKMFEEAHAVVDIAKSQVSKLWTMYEIDRRAGQWDAVKLSLEQLIANENPKTSLDAKKSLEWICREYTREYEKAIKLSQEISEPPGTLWNMQTCYRRMGEKAKAQATLEEIKFFPEHAARAVWHQAEYYREDGEKDKAVALYRRLLSQPEWKKTWESSQAHQRLEAWGIATGGAVVNEVR